MKFDLFAWQEIDPATKYETAKGSIVLQASKDVALYASAEGVEVLVGVGTSIKAQFAQQVEYWVEGPAKTRVFVHAPGKLYHEPVGEIYTNADRMPDESGTVAEITKAMRQFKLEQRAIMRQMREQSRRLRPGRDADPEPAEETAEERDPPGDPSDVATETTTPEAPNTDAT